VGLAGLAAWRFLGCSGNLPAAPTGSKTASGHWGQNCLGNELMSSRFVPYAEVHKLSIVTIGAMMDLGYVVNFGAADDFGLDDLDQDYCGEFCPEIENRRKLNPTNKLDEDVCGKLSTEDTEMLMNFVAKMLSTDRAEARASLPQRQVSLADGGLNMILKVGEGVCGMQITRAEVQKWQYESTN
jgi:hypothetical protein